MRASISKYRQDRLPIAALLLLGSLAFIRLLALPAFEDEGTELRWIWRVIEAGEWLQPLADGKPLEVWPMVPLVWLGLHPLTAVRAMNVLAGMAGAVLTYRLARQLGDRRTAFVCGACFAICPFVVYLQRLALAETFLCTAGIWALISVLQFIKSPTTWHAVLVAASLFLVAFCKFPVGFIFLISMPLAFVTMPAAERRNLLRQPALRRVFAAHVPVLSLALIVALVATVQVWRGQSPGFGLKILAGEGMGRYQDIAKTLGVPGISLTGELAAQLSWPVVVIGGIGIAASLILGDWRQRWLVAVGAVPMLGMALLAEFWFPRYLLFTLPPLIVGAVLGWRSLAPRVGRFGYPLELGVVAICAGLLGRQSALLILNPRAANWSQIDRVQYFEGWSSGYGYREAANFILGSSEVPPMIYSLDGHSSYQLRSYLPPEWAGRVKPIFYGEDGNALRHETARLNYLLANLPAWIVISEQLLPGYLASSFGSGTEKINLRQIAKFDKPGTRAQLAIYAITLR
jgi:4-amino-4-deoxy-L-arabinose transferase-like glycosyltransferase